MASARRFEMVEGSSSKFWEVRVEGDVVETRYGRIGTDGQFTRKSAGSPDAANKMCEKLIREKTGKGYVEVGAKVAPPEDVEDGSAEASGSISAKTNRPSSPTPAPVEANIEVPSYSTGSAMIPVRVIVRGPPYRDLIGVFLNFALWAEKKPKARASKHPTFLNPFAYKAVRDSKRQLGQDGTACVEASIPVIAFGQLYQQAPDRHARLVARAAGDDPNAWRRQGPISSMDDWESMQFNAVALVTFDSPESAKPGANRPNTMARAKVHIIPEAANRLVPAEKLSEHELVDRLDRVGAERVFVSTADEDWFVWWTRGDGRVVAHASLRIVCTVKPDGIVRAYANKNVPEPSRLDKLASETAKKMTGGIEDARAWARRLAEEAGLTLLPRAVGDSWAALSDLRFATPKNEISLHPTTCGKARFGSSLVVEGERLLVGATARDSTEGVAGACLYTHSSDGWTLTGTFSRAKQPPGEYDDLASAIALRGPMVVANAPGHENFDAPIHIWDLTEETWSGPRLVEHPDRKSPHDEFYWAESIALAGDDLVVGDVFDRSVHCIRLANGPREVQRLRSPAPGMSFGDSLALDGDLLAVRAPNETGSGMGAIYLFERRSGEWALAGSVEIADVGPIALAGDFLVVGVPKTRASNGQVVIYKRMGETVSAWEVIEHPGGPAHFGSAVAFDGRHLAVGARGAVWLFNVVEGRIVDQCQWIPDDLSDDEWFGSSVALGPGWVAAGAPSYTKLDRFGRVVIRDW